MPILWSSNIILHSNILPSFRLLLADVRYRKWSDWSLKQLVISGNPSPNPCSNHQDIVPCLEVPQVLFRKGRIYLSFLSPLGNTSNENFCVIRKGELHWNLSYKMLCQTRKCAIQPKILTCALPPRLFIKPHGSDSAASGRAGDGSSKGSPGHFFLGAYSFSWSTSLTLK